MAGSYATLGDATEAVKFLKEANERRPGDFWIDFELAYACEQTKPPATDEAIRYYTAALMLRPNSSVAHDNLGVASDDKRQLDEAIAEYRKALQIQPDYAEAHNNLGSALSRPRTGWTRRSRSTARPSKSSPTTPRPTTTSATPSTTSGQLDEAIAEYRKALQIQPDYAEAHNNLGIALYDKRQLDEAIAEYRKALQIQPDYAMAHNNLGNAL